MKRRLFEDLVVSAAGGRRSRGGLGWPVSLTLHAVGVAGLLALPALTTEALPDPPARPIPDMVVVLPTPVPDPVRPVPPSRPAGGGQRRQGPAVTTRRMVAVPVTVPDTLPTINEEEPPTLKDDGDVGFCIGNCSSTPTGGDDPQGGGTVGSDLGPGRSILRVGGVIKAPTKIRDVRPVYPALAQQIRLQGVVVLECIISADGLVQEVEILAGPPLLQESAREAVRQWRYTPTFLNGERVPVIMTVTVNFILH